jgi:hypothetical protein
LGSADILPGRFPLQRRPLLLEAGDYLALKDPCPVRLGDEWHLFGTGAHPGYRYDILHAVAPAPDGPWRLRGPSVLPKIAGSCVAAPGVVAQDGRLHMFVQTEYNLFDGVVEHLVSVDGGDTFEHRDTALRSVPGTGEAGIYDPHPACVGGWPYLVYSGFSRIGRPDLFLARSAGGGWDGPWERLGCVLHHEQVPGHNQHDDPAYEWGLEGAQLIELPDGQVLLNAVCFLGGAPAGNRQRVFFATAPGPTGPYRVHGPALDPVDGVGEVGHAAGAVYGGELVLLFQERTGDGPWRYGVAAAPLAAQADRIAS